jgi:hypothetical protein
LILNLIIIFGNFVEIYKLSCNISLAALATAHHHVGAHLKCIRPTEDIFNPEDPKIREVKVLSLNQFANFIDADLFIITGYSSYDNSISFG